MPPYMPPPALEFAADAPQLLAEYRRWRLSPLPSVLRTATSSIVVPSLPADLDQLRGIAAWSGPGPGPVLMIGSRPVGLEGPVDARRGQVGASTPPLPQNALTERHRADETWQLARTVLLARLLASQAAAAADRVPARAARGLRHEARALVELADQVEPRLPSSSEGWLATWRARIEQQEPIPPARRVSVRPVSLRR